MLRQWSMRRQRNATRGLASYCEPALRLSAPSNEVHVHVHGHGTHTWARTARTIVH